MSNDNSSLTKEKLLCKNCGSSHLFREEVDVGVGTMFGPVSCDDCGWSSDDDLEQIIEDDDEPANDLVKTDGPFGVGA